MKKYNILAHTCFIGETGYANHSRQFFTKLNKYHNVKVRNFTVGNSWQHYNEFEHDKEFYITDEHRNMLIQQTLWNTDGSRNDYPLYNYKNDFIPDIHIILEEVNHYYFYDDYKGYKIAYTVWETTKYPEEFFNKLLQYDELWVPTEWQKECSIKQGYPSEKIKVIIEGVDTDVFKPIEIKKKDNIFKFLLFGRWEYRKSTKEIIKAFNETFSENEPVELICSIDNNFANDYFKSSQDRLNYYNLNNKHIKLLNFLSHKDYCEYLKQGDVFLSCARGEGWNLPLIEAMSCGIPSIYSNWGGQLQFAKNKGIPINIIGENSASVKIDDRWFSNSIGNYCEPDFNHLKKMMREIYTNYNFYKKKAMKESIEIHNNFNWEVAAKTADNELQKIDEYKSDFIFVACGDLNYMPLLEKLVISILKFSKRKILLYGINCEIPFDYPNLIKKRIDLVSHSKYDKWYWKQYICIDSLNQLFEYYVWIDADVIVNYNIDNIEKYFNQIENYPISDIHVQEEFFFENKDGSTQLFNEKLIKYYNNTVKKSLPYSHVCFYIYNKKCKWWFDEILNMYKSTDLKNYLDLYPCNDESIDNFLRWKYKFNKFLPLSNFDVSEHDGDLGSMNKDSVLNCFYTFWNESGPKNFNMIYGWKFVPKNKKQILYFHGNKDLDVCDKMINFIELQKNNNLYNSHYFYTKKYELKNLGSINGVCGATVDIASKYGWDYAIYHEIFNLKDYYHENFIKIKKGDTVVDLGANIGIFNRFAHIEGAKKIISFEPDMRYFTLLKLNADKSSILFNAAISDNVGESILTESSHLGGSHILYSNGLGFKKYKVKTYTLNYLFETQLIDKIDLLKIDIEGAEIMAMNGISDENLLKVNQISMEYHHAHLNYDETLRNNLITRLNNLGFKSYLLFCGYNNALQLIYFWR